MRHTIAPLPADDRQIIRETIERYGEVGAARLLGVSRHTVLRAVAGLGVYPGTRALLRQQLDALEGRRR